MILKNNDIYKGTFQMINLMEKENIFGIILKKNMMVILLMEKFMEMDI